VKIVFNDRTEQNLATVTKVTMFPDYILINFLSGDRKIVPRISIKTITSAPAVFVSFGTPRQAPQKKPAGA
jgi:hypothetical protein